MRYFIATTFGGVPIGVPSPPMFAANGTAMAIAILPGSSESKSAKTGAMIASIIAVVAVLLMNIENSAVIIMTPSMTIAGFLPNGLMRTRARLISSLYFVAAAARKNPPRKSKIIGEAKVWKISVWGISVPKPSAPALLRSHISAPSETMTISRKIMQTEAAKTGIGSKIQKIIAKAKMASKRRSTIVIPSMGITSNGSKRIRQGTAMPKKRLNIFFTETILFELMETFTDRL